MRKIAQTLALPLILMLGMPAVPRAEEPQTIALDADQQLIFNQTLVALRDERYGWACQHLGELADAGHAPSARLALRLVGDGTTPFAAHWTTTPAQRSRWGATAVADDRLQSSQPGAGYASR